ncbi:MAG: 23S rRNA (adenine(2030)-N(6))-methyltransferase RlmJ [Rickettsiales bacterium]|nr:23S rRNA (adenine(2030)-N(6))-methyltransferase RlmJ [Rickettsiales bacterium]
MNYHHIYHAGNFADIFKHIILTICLEKFHEKPTPFFALDTHGGIGKYDLSDEKSQKTCEAFLGIKKILQQENFKDFLPARYLKILAKINNCEIADLPSKLRFYAGSPTLIKDYLRSQDRAIFAELNREDFAKLRANFAGNKKFSILNCDGFELLKSKLPPLEKRGIIIIDPAFEKDQKIISDDYEKIIFGLKEAYKRFAHGVYLVWFPIIKSDKEVLEKFYYEISQLKFEKVLHAVFDVGAEKEDKKMSACGMFVFNAPWQLEEKLKIILPPILEILQKGEDAKFVIKSSS